MTQSTLQSLAQAVEAHYEELLQFVRKRTGSYAIAEEVVQETWIRAHGLTADMPDNPRAYLYRMAGNLAIDHIRRERARSRILSDEAEDGGDGITLLESLACSAPNPVERTISRQELTALNAAIRELPDKCREVFLLYRGEGMTMKEVAADLGITQKTVEKHIARAMIHCRRRLREAGRNV